MTSIVSEISILLIFCNENTTQIRYMFKYFKKLTHLTVFSRNV